MNKRVTKVVKNLPGANENKQTIILGIAPAEPVKKNTFRISGHLADNMLKSGKPKGQQTSIFDTMREDIQRKVLKQGLSPELINRKGEGIRLSKGEYKLVLCLSKLLHDKSQTTNSNDDDYYTGNRETEIVQFKTDQGNLSLKSPNISLTLREIAKEFYGNVIGGENIKTVEKLLRDISEDPEKWAYIGYTRHVDLGKGVHREWLIEGYEPLVKILEVTYKDVQEGKQIDERKEMVINLHPIFIDQISSKYVELLLDLQKRMEEAYGSRNVSEITQLFIVELARAHSNRKQLEKDLDGNPIYIIGQNKLYWKIASGYMDPVKDRVLPNRKPVVATYINKSIETAKAIGLLIDHELRPAKDGGSNYYFTLAKDAL